MPCLRSCEPVSETCFSMDSLMAAGEGWLGGAGPALGAEEISHGLEELIYGSSICPAVSSRRRTGLLALSRTPPLALASASLPLVRILASASGSCAHRARHSQIRDRDSPNLFSRSTDGTRPPLSPPTTCVSALRGSSVCGQVARRICSVAASEIVPVVPVWLWTCLSLSPQRQR